MFGKVIIMSLFVISTTSMASELQADIKTVDIGQQFNINVSLSQTEPIKAYEFSISYNESIVKINTIDQGNIFNKFSTFKSPTMRIENGTIKDVYSLILGKGNTTENGTVLIINATAINIGKSPIIITGAGITNESKYLELAIRNGEITVNQMEEYNQKDVDIPEIKNNDFTKFIILILSLFFFGFGIKIMNGIK